jgi:hypothetical protein
VPRAGTHAAQPNGRDLKVASSKFALLHVFSFSALQH